MRMNAMQGGMGQYPIRYNRSMARRAMRRDRAMSERDMRRGDRGMPYGYDMQGDMARGNYRGNNMGDMARRDRGDYANYDMAGGGMDGHQMGTKQGGSTYYPIQAMGTFEGYYGMPNQDHARGDRGDYRGGDMAGYNMRGGMIRNDYGYPMYPNYMHYPPYDFGYPMGDFGETLSVEELEKWNKKLLKKVEEKYRPFFTKENVMQRAKQKGYEMKEFGENELLTATLMQYTDLCHYLKPFVGENLDAYIGAGYGFLVDNDAAVKGAEKLAVYYEEFVMGGEDD